MKQNRSWGVFSGIILALIGLAGVASAHVVVKPSSVEIDSYQVFTMGVPSEKNIPTIAIRLVLPSGLKFVTPNVKAGWKVAVKTQATGKKITNDNGALVDEMKPIEINWTNGSIPAGQRDEFSFQALVPAMVTSLPWKAYQTYQDGSVVPWDQTPSTVSKNPFSVTDIANDLSDTSLKLSWWQANQINLSLGVSLLALIISLVLLIKHKK